MTKLENEWIMSGEFDKNNAVLFIKAAIDETSKLYGPVFTRMVSEHAVKFEAEKLKEKPPQNIRGMDDVYNYIIVNFDKYPLGYNSLIYGIAKAESKLQGSLAAGSKRASYSAVKALLEFSGMLSGLIETTEEVFDALKSTEAIGKATKMCILTTWTREENNAVTMVVPNCLFKDACRALQKEGMSRMVGGSECINLIDNTATAEIITKKHYDYRLEEFDKPECRGKIYEI